MTLSKGQLASRLNMQPLLFAPAAEASLMSLPEIAGDDKAFFFDAKTDLGNGRPYRLEDGFAVIPVHGALLHREEEHYPGYFTGYAYITNLVDAAANDPSVRGIILDVASHGGEVNGCFDCADVIAAVGKTKPVYAVVDGYAHSAGYALASQASKIFMSETASVGSIGVVTMHVDYSEMLKEVGIKVTMIYAGEQKVDGNPYAPLGKDAKARIEARVQKSYSVFVAKVDRGRGIGEKAIRGTEAGCFAGPEAVEIGLADAVMSPREAFAAIKGGLSGSATITSIKGASTMSAEKHDDKQEPVAAAAVETAQVVDTPAVAAAAPAAEQAAADPRTTERQRVQAILGCEEAKERGNFASHLAFNTGMSVDEARALLAVAAKETPAKAAGNPLEAAMAATGGGAGVEADAAAGNAADENPANRILANQALATGRKPMTH